VQDELENAKAEAEEVRAQSRLTLEQTESRKKRIMQQAEEKAAKVLNDVRKDYEEIRKLFMESVKNYEDFYEGLENLGYKNVVRENNSDTDTSN